MKALVYNGPGKKSWEEKPKPSISDSTDAVVKMLRTTICGTDLHILKGDLPEVTPGRILGHEGVGIVEEIGSAVSSFRIGRVVDGAILFACRDHHDRYGRLPPGSRQNIRRYPDHQ